MKPNQQPIGVLDSGVGGLSVLMEMKKLLPKESFIFIADQAYMPYGEKAQEQLVDRVEKIITYFQNRKVKAVVMACNTATVYTIDAMRQKFNIPLVGTVPVVKTLANISKTRTAAVFSTPATAKSPYLKDLITKFAPDMNILRVSGSNLEELIERGDLHAPEISAVLLKELPSLLKQNIDAIALGCTHYPFLQDQIKALVGPDIAVVDSGGAVARQLLQILKNNDSLSNVHGRNEFYTTGDLQRFKLAMEKLLQYKPRSVGHVDL